jgi:Xaa-Pro aminopeptidase
MLDPTHARARQQRLLREMQRRRLDAVVVGAPEHVYYLAAHRTHVLQQSALVLWSDGRSWLVVANEPATNAGADETVAYVANPMGTQRQEQPEMVAGRVVEILSRRRTSGRVGVDASLVTSSLAALWEFCPLPIAPILWQLRRNKDPDELALMKTAIACTKAMYECARQIIRPGIEELTVYNELHAAAVLVAGEPLSPAYLGNDYACGVPGGAPRRGRTAQEGELYILDLGPAFRGYFADNSRAYAVDRKPTDAQLRAWEIVTGVFPIIERLAKPGVRCRDLFDAANEHYLSRTGKPFPHHLGHGVGLQPHEYPHLNPKWDDVLLEGEVFTAEPGMYATELRAGLRIENQYLVTATGVENLTPFPMELV